MEMRRPRVSVAIGDVPAYAAARRMGLSEADFAIALPELLRRGFPSADATTGNFDLEAIDEWRRSRHRQLFGDPTLAQRADDCVRERIETHFARG